MINNIYEQLKLSSDRLTPSELNFKDDSLSEKDSLSLSEDSVEVSVVAGLSFLHFPQQPSWHLSRLVEELQKNLVTQQQRSDDLRTFHR